MRWNIDKVSFVYIIFILFVYSFDQNKYEHGQHLSRATSIMWLGLPSVGSDKGVLLPNPIKQPLKI